MNNNYKNKNYYNIKSITLNYNLLDIADMLKEIKQVIKKILICLKYLIKNKGATICIDLNIITKMELWK